MDKLIPHASLHSSIWSSVWRDMFYQFSPVDFEFNSVDLVGASGMFDFIRHTTEDFMSEIIKEMNKND